MGFICVWITLCFLSLPVQASSVQVTVPCCLQDTRSVRLLLYPSWFQSFWQDTNVFPILFWGLFVARIWKDGDCFLCWLCSSGFSDLTDDWEKGIYSLVMFTCHGFFRVLYREVWLSQIKPSVLLLFGSYSFYFLVCLMTLARDLELEVQWWVERDQVVCKPQVW